MADRSNGIAVERPGGHAAGVAGLRGRVLGRLSTLDRGAAIVGVSVVAIFIVAAVLRLVYLGDREMFRDEGASWLAASLPLPDLFARVAGEPYPPLYALLLKAWMAAFGDGPAALRSFSVVCNLVVVFAAWRWATEAMGTRAGLIAAALVAFAPMAIVEARNTRMYALETAFATVGWWLAWRLTRAEGSIGRPRLTAVALAVCVAGEVWTMAYGIPIAGLQLLVTAFLGWRARRPLAPIAVFLGGLTYLPWLPIELSSPAATSKFWTGVPTSDDLRDTLIHWAGGGAPVSGDFTRLLVLPAMALGIVLLSRRRDRALQLALIGGIVLAPALWEVSQFRPVYDQRYFGSILPPMALALGAVAVVPIWASSVDTRRVWLERARQAAGLAVAGAVLVATIWAGITAVGDWRIGRGTAPASAAMEAVAAHMQPGDVVLAPDTRSFFLVAYFAGRSTDPIRVPGPVFDWHRPDEPFYFGGSLVGAASRVEADTAARVGLRAAIPGLAPGGHIWLVALANNSRIDGFAPLKDGTVQVVGNYDVVDSNGDRAYVRELEPLT